MLIYNKILNSRIFQFLPYFICNYIFKKITYFKYSNKKELIKNNYEISGNEIINLDKEYYLDKNIKTCNYLPQLLKIIFGKENFTFCDYGCGSLINYFILKEEFNINYLYKDQIIIDNILEKYIRKHNIKDIKKFTEKIKNIDFFYFGASFQYIENINQLLKQKSLFKSKYIFLSGIITYKQKKQRKIIMSQHNVNKEIFLNFYNEDYLNNIFISNGYEIIFSETNKTDLHINYNNLKKLDPNYKDILYKKK